MKCFSYLIIILLLVYKAHFTELEEAAVSVELFGMDLEDQCSKIADAQKQVLLSGKDAFKEQIDIEEEYGRFAREEAKDMIEKYVDNNYEFSPVMNRQWSIIKRMGDVNLPEDSWNKLIKYKNSNAQLSDELRVPCFSKMQNCTASKQDVKNILATSHNAKELQEMWSASQEIYSSTSKEYVDIIKLINSAAKANDMDEAKEYWEMLVEYPDAYETANSIWEEIKPLYVKLHKFVKTRLERFYPEIKDSNSIPVYLLGTEYGTDWSNIAPLILPHRYLYDEITSMLDFDKIGGRKLYEIAEKFTSSMGLPKMRQMFWKTSVFDKKCPAHLLTHCSDKFSRVITCNATSWIEYLDAHENMVRAALNNFDYSAYTYSAFRISALDEALTSLSTILAVKNLPLVGIVPEDIFFKDDDKNEIPMTALLMTALRVLPRLPYYLLADTWRLQELENPSLNISAAWWTQRETVQLVTGVSNAEWDFLGDSYMTSNKPYIGKFLGTVLQFKILEYFQSGSEKDINILTRMAQDENFRTVLKDRPSEGWSKLVYDNLYYDVEADGLLEYFRPLEEYMDKAPEMQVIQTVIPKKTTALPKPTIVISTTQVPVTVTEVKPMRDTPVNENVKVEEKQAVKANIKVQSANTRETSAEQPAVAVVKTPEVSQPTAHEPQEASWTGTWIGATVGVASLAIIIAIVARKRFRKRPLTNNRRHEV